MPRILHPLVDRLRLRLERDHDPALFESQKVLRVYHGAPAGGDHKTRPQNSIAYRLFFKPPERCFPILLKDVGDAPLLALLDPLVDIHECTAHLFGQRFSHRRFPGAHETDEDDILFAHPSEIFELFAVAVEIAPGLFQAVASKFFKHGIRQLERDHRLSHHAAGRHRCDVRPLDRRGLLFL